MPSFSFIIRDAHQDDIAPAIELDHSYETQFVWQMTLQEDDAMRQVLFRKERLPRMIEVQQTVYEDRLQHHLATHAGFMIASLRDEPDVVLAYMTIRIDDVLKNAHVSDLLVGKTYRRAGIGRRLLNVARRWAREEGAHRLLVETQTKNYPAIQFCLANGLSFCGFNDRYFPNQDIAVFFGETLR